MWLQKQMIYQQDVGPDSNLEGALPQDISNYVKMKFLKSN